jgi:hypothetical protein
MDVEQRLRHALHEGANHMEPRGRGPAAARRRGRRLVHRRRAVPATLTAAMIGATAVAVWPRDDGGQDVSVGTGGNTPDSIVGNDRFEWRATDATVTQQTAVFAGSDGVYYALGTAPGTRFEDYPDGDVPQALYRSTDGMTWQSSALGEKPWIADLSERDGVLYALGTAPGSRSDVTPRFGVSSDGGATWNEGDLPTTAAPPAGATVELESSSVQSSLAVGAGAMVATVRTNYWFDLDALLTPEERAQNMFASVGDAGIEVQAPIEPDRSCLDNLRTEATAPAAAVEPTPEDLGAQCFVEPPVVRTKPWSELGISGMQDLAVDEMFVSNDGESWHAVSSPFAAGDYVEVTATPDGFFATGTRYSRDGSDPETTFARSTDGEVWEPFTTDVGSVSRAGVVGSSLVGVKEALGRGAHVATSGDGGSTWSTTDLGALVTDGNTNEVYVGAFDTGPLGVALTLSVPGAEGSAEFLLTSRDGTTWTVTPLSEIAAAVGRDAAQQPWIAWVAVGSDNIVLTVGSSGSAGERHVTYVGTPIS